MTNAATQPTGELALRTVAMPADTNPAGDIWSLPLYELALLTAWHLADAGVIGVELAVVTPEQEPMEAFGPPAGRLMRSLLADRGIVVQ